MLLRTGRNRHEGFFFVILEVPGNGRVAVRMKCGVAEGLVMRDALGAPKLVLSKHIGPHLTPSLSTTCQSENGCFVLGDKQHARELAVKVLTYFMLCLPNARRIRVSGSAISGFRVGEASNEMLWYVADHHAKELLDKEVFGDA